MGTDLGGFLKWVLIKMEQWMDYFKSVGLLVVLTICVFLCYKWLWHLAAAGWNLQLYVGWGLQAVQGLGPSL